MGTTTTSLHVQIPPGAADATADTIAKAIEKLGYKRLRKASAAADKHVVLLRPEGARFVAVFDRDNAALDSGELRELAALVTHELATAALHVSVLDSDSGEVVVYRKGKQVDAVGVGMQDDSPARLGSAENIAGTGSVDSPFADDRIASWCRAADLDPAIALAVFDEVAANPEANHLHFARDASRRRVPAPPSGGVDLRFFTDDSNRPEHLVYPAAWPVQAGFAHPAQWFAVSEGAGFSTVRVRLGIDPACGLSVFRIALSSSPFHNGQVMGNPVATFEWKASPSQPWWDPAQAVEIADFKVPAPVAGSRSRQILVLTLSVGALRVTDGEVRPILEVIAPSAHTHAFTPLRFAVIEPAWTPFVMRPLPVRRSAADPLYPDDATREQAFRLLNGSGVVSAFAVLADPEGALSSARALAGALLAACNGDARAVLRTQTPMTQGAIRRSRHSRRPSPHASTRAEARKRLPRPGASKMQASRSGHRGSPRPSRASCTTRPWRIGPMAP
ncbi:MAG: hypothetical protein IT518_15170 [Burkholderiales bacterium]|nr:hypothetical protein [Burkholderiales bacterium]